MEESDDHADPWQVTVSPASVAAWSRRRLAFEPRGTMIDYRGVIRHALRNLGAAAGHALIVTYLAPDDDFVDVENAALYNVGSGAYSHLVRGGLSCERRQSPDGKHHLIYRRGLLPGPPGARTLLRLQVASPGDTHKPGPWWAAFRSAALRQTAAKRVPGPFAIDAILAGSWTSTQIAAVVKPMLDGFVSALHQHDSSHRDELLPRIADLGNPDAIWDMLCDPHQNLLGTRSLIRPNPNSYAWNPADNLCDAFRIRIAPAPTPARSVIAELRSVPTAVGMQ